MGRRGPLPTQGYVGWPEPVKRVEAAQAVLGGAAPNLEEPPSAAPSGFTEGVEWSKAGHRAGAVELGRAVMRSHVLGCAAVLGAAAALASASETTIAHNGVSCVVAERFVRIQAGVTPDDRVAGARVFFRASRTSHWYFVDMAPQAGSFWGVLPKPKKQITNLDYYIEVTDRDLGVARTAEFSPTVVSGPEGCGRDAVVAGTVASALVRVGAALGASAAPAGFSSSGVVLLGTGATAGGGVSTTTLALGAAGVGAGVVAAVALGGGSESAAVPPPDTTFTRYYGSYTATYTRHPSSEQGCFDARSLGTMVTTLSGDASGASFYFQQDPGSARWPGTIQSDGRFRAAQADGVISVEGQTDGTRISGSTRTAYCRSDFEGSR